jgi:hypothetical protein
MPESPAVFLSHSSQDREIAGIICRSLERSNVRCWIAPRDVSQGEDWQSSIIRGLNASRIVLCVLSSNANKSEQVHREINLASIKHKVLIPLRIEDVHPSDALEYSFGGVQWLDAVSPPIERHLGMLIDRITAILQTIPQGASVAADLQSEINRPTVLDPAQNERRKPQAQMNLDRSSKSGIDVSQCESNLRGQVKSQKVALLYKRTAKPDDQVLAFLESGLRASGHHIFVDRHLRVGVEWATEIERQIHQSDAVIPLLSDSSVQSEMLSMEVQIASESAQRQFGKPRILPVRIGSEFSLPEPFISILGRLQYTSWRDPADSERLLKDLLDGLEAKGQTKVLKAEMPGGAVPLDSQYYIVQPTDIEFHEGLDRQDGLLLVKGARQMGKTSLLARGLQQARDAGKTVVILDLQKLNQEDLRDLTSLYKALGGMIADQLQLDVYPEDKWRPGRAPNINFENYIVREVMRKIDGHIVIAMDEVDRLFSFAFANEIFGMFRSWFNDRSTNPDMPWGRLTQAFVYATEPHLFITDQYQSPFNVGTKLELHDFNIDQVANLNELYKRPIGSRDDLERFYALFRGHPYLSRRGFYELTRRPTPMILDDLVLHADMDEGPFGDHLRRILIMIARDEKTLEVVTGMIHGQPIPDLKSFYGLRSGGLISGHSLESARFRCAIYQQYLKRHLG